MQLMTRFTISVSHKLFDIDKELQLHLTKNKPYLVLGCDDGYFMIADDSGKPYFVAPQNSRVIAHESLGGVPCNA